MIDAAKLDETPITYAALADMDDWIAHDTGGQGVHCSVMRNLERRHNALRAAVEAHNAAMVARCERQTGFCMHDPKHCIACPQRDLIDVPGPDAAGREAR